MRRTLGLVCVVLALEALGAPVADAHFVADVGFRAHRTSEDRPVSRSILAPLPVPVPSQAPVLGGGSSWLTAAEVASYARAAGFPSSAIPQMVAYAYRESHYNAHAINLSSGACGLWQIWPCPGLQALDPATNAALAYAKFRASGFSPWGG